MSAMISRSSSAYQPLAQAAASEVATPAVPRRNYSGNATSVKIQGIVADNEDGDDDDPMSHEMTSIAIISQHPLRSGATPTISTVTTHNSGGGPGGMTASHDPRVDLELTLCNLERRRACGKDSSWNWSNFHYVMCIGVVGFMVFWFILLCRMYLPLEYQFWAKPKP